MPRIGLLVLLAALAAASLAAALLFGSLDITVAQLADILLGGGQGIARDVVLELRWPRAAAAFACGALLALAGVLLQALLRNPLADPYVFGVSGGAALGALGAMLIGAGAALIQAGALTGAAVAIALVFVLTWRAGDWNLHRLLLTGVVLAAGFGAATSLILTVAPQAQVKGMLFWLMGDLSGVERAGPAWLVLAVVLAAALVLARALNVLTLGAAKARALGVAVGPLQLALFFAAALATTAAVTLGGSIGFIGLVVPHALRLAGAHDHRLLLPAAALAGGCLLTVADTAARTVWAPQQLPVGILTALIGVPVMLWLLSERRR